MSWDHTERRQFVRVKLPCKVTVRDNPRSTISCYTENISAGGIRVILQERIKISSSVDLAIETPKQGPIICRGRIVWAFSRTADPEGTTMLFDTGIEFEAINNKDLKTINDLVASILCAEK